MFFFLIEIRSPEHGLANVCQHYILFMNLNIMFNKGSFYKCLKCIKTGKNGLYVIHVYMYIIVHTLIEKFVKWGLIPIYKCVLAGYHLLIFVHLLHTVKKSGKS